MEDSAREIRDYLKLQYDAARQIVGWTIDIRFRTLRWILAFNAVLVPAYIYAWSNLDPVALVPAGLIVTAIAGFAGNIGALIVEARTTWAHDLSHGKAEEIEQTLGAPVWIGLERRPNGIGGVYTQERLKPPPVQRHRDVLRFLYGLLSACWIGVAVLTALPSIFPPISAMYPIRPETRATRADLDALRRDLAQLTEAARRGLAESATRSELARVGTEGREGLAAMLRAQRDMGGRATKQISDVRDELERLRRTMEELRWQVETTLKERKN